MIQKMLLEAQVKSLQGGEFEIIASTGDTDRMGDVINPEGWYLTNYKKNPVIQWAHNNQIPAVGKAIKVWVDKKKLMIKGVFASSPFAQELRQLVESGFLNAVSVGFLPLVADEKGNINIEEKMYRRATEQEMTKNIYGSELGIRFEKQELLEVSWVNVPALPQAIVTARKEGLVLMTKALEEIEGKIEDYDTCKCGSEKIKNLEIHPDEGVGTFTTATVLVQQCGDCGRIRRIQGDAGAPMKLLGEIGTKETYKETEETVGVIKEAVKPVKEVNEIKEGRVLSAKTLSTIKKAQDSMGNAIDALEALLLQVESDKSITPEESQRSQAPELKKQRVKIKISPELFKLRVAIKAIEQVIINEKVKAKNEN